GGRAGRARVPEGAAGWRAAVARAGGGGCGPGPGSGRMGAGVRAGARGDAGGRAMSVAPVIRRVGFEDLPQVMRIEYASYTTPWTEATYRELLRRSDAVILGAEAEGRLVGYAVFWVVADQGELGNIAVAPDWRGRGVGKKLVEAGS